MSIITLSGKGKWSQNLFKPDDKFGPAFYSQVLYPDDTSMEIFRNAKLRLRPKDDEDGTFIRLKKYHAPVVFGERVLSEEGPPPVMDVEGNPWPEGKVIGNGSTLSCRVEIYKSRFGMGHRLLSVKVDELVEYETEVDTKEKMPF